MEQLTRLWNSLSWKQRISLAAALIAVTAAVWGGVQWNRQRDLRPLFTNLAPEDAAAIVEKLRQSNTRYQVSANGTILVPSERVAELRIEMAGAGLPRTGRVGFELFDQNNLGVTDFAEHVNYRRALEGELERSVMALSEVERARVHVTFAKDSLFTENRQPAKASVMVKLRPGARLSPQNVTAIQHLTASAVEGLDPSAVSVLDMTGNLLSRPPLQLGPEGPVSSAMLEFRQNLEREYLAKIRSTLDPLLGPERYRAGVSVECDFSSGEQSEETFDPSKSVMVTSARTEDLSGAAAAAGIPGTASNLPRPAPRVPGSSGGVSRKTENITYQTSRVVRHIKIPQGTVRRISVAVLVDHRLRWEGTGPRARRVLEPPAPETLKVVRDVLAGVVGYQQERGDQILVESLPFEMTLKTAPPPEPTAVTPLAPSHPGFVRPAWLKPLLEKAPLPVWLAAAAALLIVLAAVTWLLVRRLRRSRPPAAVVEPGPAAIAATAQAQIGPAAADDFEKQAMAVVDHNRAEKEKLEREALLSLQSQQPPQTRKAEVLRKVIADQVKKDPAATAQLIRTWITENR
ncbi:MAG: flagellar basal-body MS-ring/collar protein FliF [Bryobacteraceae bacterium]